MSRDTKDPEFWKRKLMAFLHDPPHKPYGVKDHEKTIESNLRIFGLELTSHTEDEKKADHFAASADRFIFPDPKKNWPKEGGTPLRTNWKSYGCVFIHPFCGVPLAPHTHPVTVEVAEDWMSSVLSGIIQEAEPTKENFIKAWRLWERELTRKYNKEKNSGLYMPYLVADTRIPDHTIWQHNALTSAIASSLPNPAFLFFQIGPVQSFIAQARSTRDLWAGSYILSYLTATAIHYIADELGPDHIVFPSIKGNPIIDKKFWKIYGQDLDHTEEAELKWRKKILTVPSLPNRFMAIIPYGDKDAEIANEVEKKVREEWKTIADKIHEIIQSSVGKDFPGWDELWEESVGLFPRIDTFIFPIEDNDIIKKGFEQNEPPVECLEKHPVMQNYKWATENIPEDYRDERCYKKGDLFKIDNWGFTWALQYMKAEWLLGALRNSRIFNQKFEFSGCEYQNKKRWIEKDHLDGTFEIIGGSDEKKNKEFWTALCNHEDLGKHFKKGEETQRYGAINIIKRLFHLGLAQIEGFSDFQALRVKSTYEIATKRDNVDSDEDLRDDDIKYYAVICIDGDNMGKWLSGENSMPVKDLLLGESIKRFFSDNTSNPEMKRAVTPSYHLAFSEALNNFALYCVEPIISKFEGQLIYSGGDDVLAMVPAENAIPCAEALQYAFRGLRPEDQTETNPVWQILSQVFDYEWSYMEEFSHVDGFLLLKQAGSARPNHLLMLPGPRATLSAGIAIGHLKSPMQDLIQAARDAEEDAKDSGKDGFCLTIMKRSGETNSFFAHWNRKDECDIWKDDSVKNYCQLHYFWNRLWNDPKLQNASKNLPYSYLQYTMPLMRDFKGEYVKSFDSTLIEACKQFFRIVLERQAGLTRNTAIELTDNIFNSLNLYTTTPENYMNFWMCYAFMKRIMKGED